MTHHQLHNAVADYPTLKTDERFNALILHLQHHRPTASATEAHGMIQDSGKLEQFNRMMDLINKSFEKPPEIPPPVERSPRYAHGHTPLSSANQP